MKAKLMIYLAICLTFASVALAQSYTGVIKVDSVNANPGNHFGVKVRIDNNNLAFSGLTIPLSYQNEYLTLDSVSFAGSIKPANFNGVVLINSVEKTVAITYLAPYQFSLPLETISTGDGIIAELFFSLATGASAQTIVINAIDDEEIVNYDGTDIRLQKGIYISDNTGEDVYSPEYEAGNVVVLISTAVAEDNNSLLPNEFALSQNYPNPFNPATTIEFSLPSAGQAKLEIFNILGQNVATLIDGTMSAGNHKIEFDASNQPSGIYFYRLIHEKGSDTKKMVLVK